MIRDLDNTIAALLRRDFPSTIANQVQISFETPGDDFPPQSVTLPAINLFLYDIRENLELRSNEVYLERRDDLKVIKTLAPVRVDFSYMVTAWPSKSAPNPAEDEHQLLGEVMRVFLRCRKIPEDVLQGVLKEQKPSLPTSSLQPGRLQSVGEFWQALGGKPKAALNYQVTVSVDVMKPEELYLVTEKTIKMHMQRGDSN